MLNYIKINKDNILLATKIQMDIFPYECAYKHYLNSINNRNFSYYLVYEDEDIVGITGLYSYEKFENTNSIWLGWFGVLEKYRNMGYGRKILEDTIDMAKDLSKKYPIKYLRLYTSTRDNAVAQKLYENVMDMKEDYDNIHDYNYDNTCVIYTKSLADKNIEKWNNKFLNLKAIIQEQNDGLVIYKKGGNI